MNISDKSSPHRRPPLSAWRLLPSLGLTLLALALPLSAQTLNYAEGADPTADPAATDGVPTAKRYYVESAGSNSNNGHSPGAAGAWKDLTPVNSTAFAAGSYIMFKRGETFAGNLNITNQNGTSGNRIVYGAYGTGITNGDGDPFNDTRPKIGANTPLNGTCSWLMIRDLDTGKLADAGDLGTPISDVIIFNNVVHGRAGQDQSNMIRINDDATRCAIVQNLIYDVTGNDIIALHDAAHPTSAVGPSHWIVDNVILGNGAGGASTGAESGIDLAIAHEDTGITNSDFKVIGNRLQMKSGKVPGVTQLYSGAGRRGLEGSHIARHTWLMGNMVTGTIFNGIKRGGQVQYVQISGNIVWRCASDTANPKSLIEVYSRDTAIEHNTTIHTGTREVLQISNFSGDTPPGFAAENTTILNNLFTRTTNGSWFTTWSTAGSVIAGMDRNWYGEIITGTVAGQTYAAWKAGAYDHNSGTGDVLGVSLPSTNATDENPKNWYGATFLNFFTPNNGEGANAMSDGTPAGALNNAAAWFGGGPSMAGTGLASKWVPSQMKSFSTLAVNGGYGWAGPAVIQQRYPLANQPTLNSATPTSSSSITLVWSNVPGESGYQIDRALSANGPWTSAAYSAGANVTTIPANGLSANTPYFFRVRAINSAGGDSSAPSNVLSATTLAGGGATVTVSATDPSASETGLATGTYRFTRTGATTAALVVNYTVSGTAASGADYASLGTSVSIPVGATFVDKVLTPVQDTAVEGNETAIVTLAAGSYTIGAPSAATVTIADNDYMFEAEALTYTNSDTASPVADPLASPVPTGSFINLNGTTGTAATFISYTINVSVAGTYTVTIGNTKRNNRGIYQLKIDTVNQGTPQDGWDASTVTLFPAGVSLGTKVLSVGNHTFRFECTGKNASATTFKHGLDYIKLTQ